MRAILFIVCFLLALVAPASIHAEERPFLVVVNKDNATNALPRKFVGDAFLKKTTRWSTGEVIKPVDLPASSSVRARFSEDVVGRSVASVKSYWQQVIFSGRDVPPPELASDADVVKYVASNPNAIGYVSSNANLTGVKPITIE